MTSLEDHSFSLQRASATKMEVEQHLKYPQDSKKDPLKK